MTTSWKDRVLEGLHGHHSRFGCILTCALGRNAEDQAPAFLGRASITSDGYVMCDFRDIRGNEHYSAFVGGLDDLEETVKRIADQMKLKSAERLEYFNVIRAWIAQDYRTERGRLPVFDD